MTGTPISVSVQEVDFDIAHLQRALERDDHGQGAIATFTGYVRSENDSRDVQTLFIEHYPGMTERSIEEIAREACERWPLLGVSIVHRVGHLVPGDQIVWVGVSSAHRGAAASATEFLMDYLKTRAPFWKRESTEQGAVWVESRDSDYERAARWGEAQD